MTNQQIKVKIEYELENTKNELQKLNSRLQELQTWMLSQKDENKQARTKVALSTVGVIMSPILASLVTLLLPAGTPAVWSFVMFGVSMVAILPPIGFNIYDGNKEANSSKELLLKYAIKQEELITQKEFVLGKINLLENISLPESKKYLGIKKDNDAVRAYIKNLEQQKASGQEKETPNNKTKNSKKKTVKEEAETKLEQ